MKRDGRSGICFFVVATHWGGAEKSLFELLLEGKGWPSILGSPWILLPKPDGPLVDALRKEGFNHEVIEMPFCFLKISRSKPWVSLFLALLSLPGVILYLLRVIRFLRKIDPALIHTTGLKCHYLSVILKPWVKAKILWHLRDIYPPGLNRAVLIGMARLFRIEVIANSIATAKAFTQERERISVVYNGLDPKRYCPKPNSRFREKFQVDSSVSIIGMVGVFSRWKGQMEFIEMAKGLISSGKNARFVLIGENIYDTLTDGGFKKELEDRIRILQLRDHFCLTGFENHIENALNGLNILVHASLKPEPFGRVVLEAMACGVPVVAARGGGIPEILEDQKSGLLYAPGNVHEMRRAVETLMDDPDQRVSLSQEARKVFLSQFTVQSYSEGVLRCCERILRA